MFKELTHVPMADRNDPVGVHEWAYTERVSKLWRPVLPPGVVAVDLSAMEGAGGGPCPVYSTNEAAPLDTTVLLGDDWASALSAAGITHVIYSEAELNDFSDNWFAVMTAQGALRINDDYPAAVVKGSKMYIVPVSVAF